MSFIGFFIVSRAIKGSTVLCVRVMCVAKTGRTHLRWAEGAQTFVQHR